MRLHFLSLETRALEQNLFGIPALAVTWYCKISSHAPKISLEYKHSNAEIALVSITKILFVAWVTVSCTGLVQAQNVATVPFDFVSKTYGNYRQGSNGVAFEGGTFEMTARDGQALFTSGCSRPAYFIPFTDPKPGCPLGATGFVSRGLYNDPLLKKAGPYYSIETLTPATLLDPFNPTAAKLVAAPASSRLPRPLAGFIDQSLSVFYNLQTPYIKTYPISIYDFVRSYDASERARYDGEVVPGEYIYNFATLKNPLKPLYVLPPTSVKINHFPQLDGYRKINSQLTGFRFKNVIFDSNGFALLDPYNFNTISWEGNTLSYIRPKADYLYFSIKNLSTPTNPLSNPDPGSPIFPNFSTATAADSRVLLTNALVTNFTLPPYFLQPGQTGVIDLEFVTFRPTTSVVYENSTRRFRLPVKVKNVFASFIKAALPPSATSLQLAANYDYDSDGVSNFTEWVFKSDPSKKSSVPSMGVLKTISAPTTPPTSGLTAFSAIPGVASQPAMEYSVAKLTNTVPSLKYTIEFSNNMTTWQEIIVGNPSWILAETETEIKVTGTGTSLNVGGFFRTKVVPLP